MQSHQKHEKQTEHIPQQWPQTVPHGLKDEVVKMFQKLTSKGTLSSFTCASCAEECLNSEQTEVALEDIDIDLLQQPDIQVGENGDVIDLEWLDANTIPPIFPFVSDPILKDVLIDPLGVAISVQGEKNVKLCNTCLLSLNHHKTLPMALANNTFFGEVPEEFNSL